MKIYGIRFKDGERARVIAESVFSQMFLDVRLWFVRRVLFPNTGLLVGMEVDEQRRLSNHGGPIVVAHCSFKGEIPLGSG
jgi:hypothetical protein